MVCPFVKTQWITGTTSRSCAAMLLTSIMSCEWTHNCTCNQMNSSNSIERWQWVRWRHWYRAMLSVRGATRYQQMNSTYLLGSQDFPWKIISHWLWVVVRASGLQIGRQSTTLRSVASEYALLQHLPRRMSARIVLLLSPCNLFLLVDYQWSV